MRRTGKVGGSDNQPKTGSEQSAQTAGENLQGQLEQMSEQMGVAIADKGLPSNKITKYKNDNHCEEGEGEAEAAVVGCFSFPLL